MSIFTGIMKLGSLSCFLRDSATDNSLGVPLRSGSTLALDTTKIILRAWCRRASSIVLQNGSPPLSSNRSAQTL